VSTAVWVGTDQSDPIKTAAGRPVFGRMLPGSIWQTFMNGAPRGEQFSPFVPLGTPLGVGSDESDKSDDEDSDDEKSDDEDKKDDGDSDRSSGDSDRGSDDSGDSDRSGDSSGRGDSGNDSGNNSADDFSDDNTVFEEPQIDVPGFRSSNAPVLRTSGQQPLAAGAG
jgi:membrane peptidoglycan carboxypeptidase